MKAFKYRIYPNNATSERLQWVLDRARELYNAALQERRDAYRMAGKSISYFEQKRDLVEIKEEIRPEYQEIASHVLQDVILRVKKAYDNFFRRCKNGEKPGHPRFQGRNRYNSFCYPDGAGWKLKDNKLILSKIGTIKVKLHREIQGKIKTVTVKREGEHWYVTFSCEVEARTKLPFTDEAIGIDMGLLHFATLSTGDTIENPRYARRGEKKLAKAQQALARKKRGSNRRKKAVQRVAKCHRKGRNQRKDFHHKQSRILVDCYETIVFEELSPKNMSRRPKPKQDETGAKLLIQSETPLRAYPSGQALYSARNETASLANAHLAERKYPTERKFLPNGAAAKGGLNKSIQDAGWGTFMQMVCAKAESAGQTTVLFVNPYKTSQICSMCLKEGPHKDLSERTHTCVHCGVVLDRDHNAAMNILKRGLEQVQVGTQPTGKPVEAPTF